ncbi:MAG TPA: BON domain-containing protein [Candidatus Lumbricidophila sp.]|nr:BON domain-containing protein [Candidatus Lumbricidophila sp.]
MTTSGTTTRTDDQIQREVASELDWTPGIDAAGIGVAVEQGTVALSGEVDSYYEKSAAKRAAFRVKGVHTVTDNLVVRKTSSVWSVSEREIATNVEKAIAWLADAPNTVRAEIEKHRVILSGEVQWNYERVQAEQAVERVRGVTDVDNRITLAKRASAADTAERIKNALARSAALDAKAISVTANGNTVTLTGAVRSWSERRVAENAAWASPHVTAVHDQLTIRTN